MDGTEMNNQKCSLCHQPIKGGYAGGLCKVCWDDLPDDEQPVSDQALYTFESYFCQRCLTLCSTGTFPDVLTCFCGQAKTDDTANYPQSWVEVEVEVREKGD